MAKNKGESVVKVEVIDGSEVIDCDVTASNVLDELRRLKNQLAERLGVEAVEVKNAKGDNEIVETAKDSITVNRDVKKELKRLAAYVLSALMAERGAGAGAGRAPKADDTALQKVWLDYVRLNPNMPKGITDYRIAVLFNEAHPSDNPVTPNNVAAYAKKGNWRDLLSVKVETETV